MSQTFTENSIVTHIDQHTIAEMAQCERAARDYGNWAQMLELYHPDSEVYLSWFKGTGPEFIEASRKRYESGERSIHLVGSTLVQINNNRGIADTGCTINIRRVVDDVLVDMACFCRHRSRVEKVDGRWYLRTLSALYQKDTLSVSNPWDQLKVDQRELDGYRASYKWLSYANAHRGGTPLPDLPGVDRPETVATLLTSDEAWLMAGERDPLKG